MSIAEVGVGRRRREDWLQAVETLFADVEVWAREWLTSRERTPAFDWDVLRREKELGEDFSRDKYLVPVLEITLRPHEVILVREEKLMLEPIGFNPSTGTGRVDFFTWPAMYRVRLLDRAGEGHWTIKTDSGLDWPLPWNKETFVQIAEGLLKA
jgi:hypothetical protein